MALPALSSLGVKFGGKQEEAGRAGLPEECRGPWGSCEGEQHLQNDAFQQSFQKVEAEVWALHADKVPGSGLPAPQSSGLSSPAATSSFHPHHTYPGGA